MRKLTYILFVFTLLLASCDEGEDEIPDITLYPTFDVVYDQTYDDILGEDKRMLVHVDMKPSKEVKGVYYGYNIWVHIISKKTDDYILLFEDTIAHKANPWEHATLRYTSEASSESFQFYYLTEFVDVGDSLIIDLGGTYSVYADETYDLIDSGQIDKIFNIIAE